MSTVREVTVSPPSGAPSAPASIRSVTLRSGVYADSVKLMQVSRSVSALPGVTGVAFTDWWPLQGAPPREVGPDSEAAPRARAGMFGVSADYFTTLGIRIVDGRAFTAADRPGAPDAAVVSQTLARTLWPGRRASLRSVMDTPRVSHRTPL